MSIVQRTKAWIDRSRSDRVNYIPTGLSKLDDHTDGLTQGTYILIGGETSVGKTAFARDTYIYTAHEYVKSINDVNKVDIFTVDICLEIMPEINNAGLITRKLWQNYDRVVPAKSILKKLTDDNYALVNSLDSELNEFYDKCIVFEEDITPTKYHDILMEVAKRFGTFTKEGRWIGECGEWIPHNPNLYIQIVLDTINLGELEESFNTIKSTIDRISRISVWFRNKCKFILIILDQFNGDLGTVERKKHGVTTPKMIDYEDSKRPGKDCDIAIGLYDPLIHLKEEETKFRGYDMTILKSWYRSAHIMKNRRGERNKVIDLKFDGAIGIFSQLPEAKDMDQRSYTEATRH